MTRTSRTQGLSLSMVVLVVSSILAGAAPAGATPRHLQGCSPQGAVTQGPTGTLLCAQTPTDHMYRWRQLGATGPAGPQGPVGPAGTQGATGPQGQPGGAYPGYAVITYRFRFPQPPHEWVPIQGGGHMAQVPASYSEPPVSFTATAPTGKVILSGSLEGVVTPNFLGSSAMACSGDACFFTPTRTETSSLLRRRGASSPTPTGCSTAQF
jgi:hypothetical protein